MPNTIFSNKCLEIYWESQKKQLPAQYEDETDSDWSDSSCCNLHSHYNIYMKYRML